MQTKLSFAFNRQPSRAMCYEVRRQVGHLSKRCTLSVGIGKDGRDRRIDEAVCFATHIGGSLQKGAAMQFGMEASLVALLGDQQCSLCNRRTNPQLLAWRSGLDGLLGRFAQGDTLPGSCSTGATQDYAAAPGASVASDWHQHVTCLRGYARREH